MKYLRHFPFTLWLAVSLTLGGLLAVAWFNAQETEITIYSNQYTKSERPAAMAALQRVSGVYPALASGETSRWARETASHFDAALKNHEKITGETEDPLGVAWHNAKIAALELSAAPLDQQHEKAAALGQAVQYIVSVVDGLTLAPAEKATLSTPQLSKIEELATTERKDTR